MEKGKDIFPYGIRAASQGGSESRGAPAEIDQSDISITPAKNAPLSHTLIQLPIEQGNVLEYRGEKDTVIEESKKDNAVPRNSSIEFSPIPESNLDTQIQNLGVLFENLSHTLERAVGSLHEGKERVEEGEQHNARRTSELQDAARVLEKEALRLQGREQRVGKSEAALREREALLERLAQEAAKKQQGMGEGVVGSNQEEETEATFLQDIKDKAGDILKSAGRYTAPAVEAAKKVSALFKNVRIPTIARRMGKKERNAVQEVAEAKEKPRRHSEGAVKKTLKTVGAAIGFPFVLAWQSVFKKDTDSPFAKYCIQYTGLTAETLVMLFGPLAFFFTLETGSGIIMSLVSFVF